MALLLLYYLLMVDASCPSPRQRGYAISPGSGAVNDVRSTRCGTGMTGTGSTITCQSDNIWSQATVTLKFRTIHIFLRNKFDYKCNTRTQAAFSR